MYTVRIENLSKKYDGVTAVDGIDLSVGKGELMTLLGPSGCGKTTTLRLIAGHETPTDGDIYIGDRLVSSRSKGLMLPPEKRQIGIVFQSYAIWPHMSVFDNVAYPLQVRRRPRREIGEKVMQTLKLVELDEFKFRGGTQLSGGQQQRVALARALVFDPDILLLDEPLSNLDAKLRESMRFYLRELQQRLGITAIYVTHDQAESMVLSDRVAVLHMGRIEQLGTPREIYETPATHFVADFIGSANLFHATVLENSTGEGVGLLESDLGRLKCRLAESFHRGDRVSMLIRPTDPELGATHAMNHLKGIVHTCVYLGDRMEYTVKINDAALRISTMPSVVYSRGEAIVVGIGVEKIRVIP